MKQALIAVDVQNDFFPGGALPTPQGDSIIDPMNRLIGVFEHKALPVVATRDWHPEDHCSFEAQGGPWPPHCIHGTEGAAFHPRIRFPDDAIVVSKATAREREAYSGFEGTDLAGELREREVTSLIIGGLATDVCVKHTVLDGLEEGFEVSVVQEAVSAVEAAPGDRRRALEEMISNGARLVSIDDLNGG